MGRIVSRRAAALAVAILVLAGCGSSGGGAAAKTADAPRRTTTTTEAPTTTTTTTLSPGECFGLIAQAQAGTLVLTDADYTTKCGPLPAVGVLAATTTTTATLPPPPPPPPPTAAPQPSCPNGGYTNVDGNYVCSPTSTNNGGATAICNDGTYSYSQHRQGTCSGHGGVRTWL